MKRAAAVLAALLVLGTGACGDAENESTTSTTAVEDPASTTAAPASTTTSVDPTAAVIPGLVAVDVYGNLEERGMTCDGPTEGDKFSTWTCNDPAASASVTIYSPSSTVSPVVSQVEATILDPSDAELLAFVATVPFEGAEPEAARAWVTETLPTVVEGQPVSATFGGVLYTLSGSPSGGAFTLEVGELA